jgi:hypothetical protein
MITPDSATTAAACYIADIDRQKLTDAISSGEYDCAPRTVAGRARTFFVPDLIALHIYARYTNDLGYPTKIAARFACEIRQILEQEPDAEFVQLIQPIMGSASATADSEVDPEITHVSGLPIRHRMIFDLRNTRARILAELAAFGRTVGNLDE